MAPVPLSSLNVLAWLKKQGWFHGQGGAYAPEKTWKWRWNERMSPVTLAVTPEWTLLCPRNALSFSFWYQLQDPPQQQELHDFIALIRRLDQVHLLDVGCHFGLLTFGALHFGGPNARATAVDASALALQMISRIAGLNGREHQVEGIHSAVGASKGQLAMVPGGRSAAGYFLAAPQAGEEEGAQAIPLTTLDHLIGQMPSVPTVIKIDVEGYEPEVIQGGMESLSSRQIPLCLELHNQMVRRRGLDPQTVLDNLSAVGYKRFISGRREMDKRAILEPEIIRFIAQKSPAN